MNLTPWKKLDKCAFSLIEKILVHTPSARYKIDDIKKHRWYLKSIKNGKQQLILKINLLNFSLLKMKFVVKLSGHLVTL